VCCLLWLACLAGGAPLAAAQGSASSPTTEGTPPLAQSAQVTVRASLDDEWLTLRLLHAGSESPLVTKDVTLSVAGHVIPLTPRGAGTYILPVKQLGTTTTPTLDITVGHDGIREVLSGKLTVPAAAPTPAGSHNQMLWWIVNIGIVFVAAMILSNRRKKSAE
jgi:hypothetical protein